MLFRSGKLAQMFGEDKTKGLRGAMLATGSAVNELAQNSSANAGYIVDLTADLSGVGIQAGMTQAQLMGLASALDQNMQEEATSATVFSQLITITYAISLMIVCIMCPVMSLIATVLFKEPGFGTWVHTWGCNMPMALCWQLLYCGPLTRAIFRLMFRRGEKQTD